MSIYKVEICGVNTSKLPLLTNEEKEELFQKILKGDKEAREAYIKGNLRLVLSVLQRFAANNAENVDDLFQIGCIGLMKAVDNFDITQGVRFSTYAVPMICGEIKRFLRDNNSIRVSLLHDPAVIHHQYPAAKFLHQRNIVADEQDRQTRSLLSAKLVQQLQDFRLNGHIQSRGGLIADEQPGLDGNGPGNSGPLALSAADLVGVAVCKFGWQAALSRRRSTSRLASFADMPAFRRLSPIPSPSVRRGSKESAGVWNTICIF